MKKSVEAWSPFFLSVLRIVAAFLFLEHGTSKIFDIPPQPVPHAVQLFTLVGFSAILELVGGALLFFGLFTRLTAFILSGEMAVAYFMVHAPHGFFPLANKGELAVLYCFVFLFLAAAGGGPVGLDRLRGKS